MVAGSDGTVPSEIRFLTRSSGSSSVLEALKLNSDKSATFSSSVSATDGLFSGELVFNGDSENKIYRATTSPITGTTTNTTVVKGRGVDILAFDDVNIRAGSSDKITFTAGSAEALRLNSDQSATFSSSVTANNKFILNSDASTPDDTANTYEEGITLSGGNQRLVIDVTNVSNGGSYIQTRHKSTSFPHATYKLALNPIGGNVLIGTQVDNGSKLQVNGSATFASSVSATDGLFGGDLSNSGNFRVFSSSFSAPSSGKSLEIRNISGSSSIVSFDRDNSLYTPITIDGSDIVLKQSGNDALTITNTGAATFASSVSASSSFISTSTGSGNPSPNSDELRVNGFGVIGNRSTLYMTNSNSNGALRFGVGGAHADNTELTISGNGATFASSVSAEDLILSKSAQPSIVFNDTTESTSASIAYNGVDDFLNISDDIVVNGTAIITSNVSATDGIFSGNTFFGTTGRPNGTSVYGSAFYTASSDKMQLEMASSSTVAGNLLVFYNPNGAVGNIQISGSSTSYNTSSDYRLKEDLKDFNGLEMVSNIPVYDYKWKADESRSFGVMAHELQEVLPNAVSGEKDAEEMQGVDYSKIVPLLIKSIQELTEKVEMLESKNK